MECKWENISVRVMGENLLTEVQRYIPLWEFLLHKSGPQINTYLISCMLHNVIRHKP